LLQQRPHPHSWGSEQAKPLLLLGPRPGAAQVFAKLHSEPRPVEAYVPWGQLAAHPSHRHLAGSEAFSRSGEVECCPLADGKDQIEWGDPACCQRLDIMGVNHTAHFVAGHQGLGR
jgi:hypothetical protein